MKPEQRFGIAHRESAFYGSEGLSIESALEITETLNKSTEHSYNTSAQSRVAEVFAIDEGQVPTFDELEPDDREQVTMAEFWFEIDNQDEAKADWQKEDYSYLKEVI